MTQSPSHRLLLSTSSFTEMPTPQSRAKSLTLLNLSSIFGQKDVSTRMQAITDLWVPSADVLFVDALGVFKSHEAISEMVNKIQSMGEVGDEFVALGKLWVITTS